ATVDRHLKDLVAGVIAELRAEGFAGEPSVSRSVSMRYWGQNYEQDVPMPDGDVTPELLDRTLDEFHRVHEQFYGYSIGGETIELIRFNVEATGHTSAPSLPSLPSNGHAPAATATSRPVFFQEHGLVDCPILQRDDLPAGFRTVGPAIVEEVVSTTLVHPGQHVEAHPTGVITITL